MNTGTIELLLGIFVGFMVKDEVIDLLLCFTYLPQSYYLKKFYGVKKNG